LLPIPTAQAKQRIYGYAEGYDTLAEQQERLARDAAELKINNQQS
jgi:hypothetical protein